MKSSKVNVRLLEIIFRTLAINVQCGTGARDGTQAADEK